MGEGTVSRTSTSMLRKAQANDAEAWQRLVDTYSRRIYRWCRQAGLQPADAANVVQEVFQAVVRNLSGFHHDQDGDTFRGWIRRITQNKILDLFRQNARRPERALGGTDVHFWMRSAATVSPSAGQAGSACDPPTTFHQIDRQVIQRVRALVSDRDWKMFWRVVVDGQSAVEVGNEFGVTANTVRLVKMRLLRQLRAAMASPQSE